MKLEFSFSSGKFLCFMFHVSRLMISLTGNNQTNFVQSVGLSNQLDRVIYLLPEPV